MFAAGSGGVSPSFTISSSSHGRATGLSDAADSLDLTDLKDGVREGLLRAELWLVGWLIDCVSVPSVLCGDREAPLDLTLTRPVLAE